MSQIPPQDPNEFQESNRESIQGIDPLEPLIDASLDAWLGTQGPDPKFVADLGKILSQSRSSLFSQDDQDQAVQRASQEIQNIARSRPIASKVAKASGAKSPARSGRLALAMIAASVGAFGLLGLWSVNRSPDGNRLQSNTRGAKSSDPVALDPTPLQVKPQTMEASAGATHQDSAMASQNRDPEVIFQPIPPKSSEGPQSDNGVNPKTMLAGQVDAKNSEDSQKNKELRASQLGHEIDRQIISVIDSQFQLIWKQLGMLDDSSVVKTLSTQRIAGMLLHRVPTSTELESIRQNRTSIDGIVNDWIRSDEFDRVWAGKLARFYNGDRSIQSGAQTAFVAWLEHQIRDEVSISEIQRQVLLGLSKPDHPAYFLRDVWSQNSKDSGLVTTNWVGLSEAQSAKLTGLSQLFLAVTGNPAVSCGQCHIGDATSNPSWLSETLANYPAVTFDSIAAMMIPVFDPAQVELFTKQQDDRVSKIAVRFPDGKRVGNEVPFEQIINAWVDQGSHDQRSMINALWTGFFGESLYLELGMDSAVAPQEKNDLVEYLCKQSVEQGASVRQFVYWMLMSQPARQNQEQVSRTEYLAMDSQKLNEYLLRRGSLKSLLVKSDLSVQTHSNSLEHFAVQLFPEQPDWLERSLLAQPASPQGSPAKSDNGSTSENSEQADALSNSNLLNAELRYRAASEQVRRWGRLLSESQLSESQLVDHVYLISKHRVATDQELSAWKRSQWFTSDRFSSVLRMLAGVQSYEP